MNQSKSTGELAKSIQDVVRAIITEVRPRLIEGAFKKNVHESVNIRHPGNFLSDFDIYLHERYKSLLGDVLEPFIYLSEEADPAIVGSSNHELDLCVLVDPLDTSELAVRALLGYTHVLVVSRALGRPVAAIVGDFFHEIQMYVAYRTEGGDDVAFAITRDNVRWPLKVNTSRRLSQSLVMNYSMRPAERFMPLANQRLLLEELSKPVHGKTSGRIGVDFGSVSLCHVAMGSTDAMVEFAKGFAAWDLFPGQYVLEAAGGVVMNMAKENISIGGMLGSPREINDLMNTRMKFVAAADASLASEIIDTLTRGAHSADYDQ